MEAFDSSKDKVKQKNNEYFERLNVDGCLSFGIIRQKELQRNYTFY